MDADQLSDGSIGPPGSAPSPPAPRTPPPVDRGPAGVPRVWMLAAMLAGAGLVAGVLLLGMGGHASSATSRQAELQSQVTAYEQALLDGDGATACAMMTASSQQTYAARARLSPASPGMCASGVAAGAADLRAQIASGGTTAARLTQTLGPVAVGSSQTRAVARTYGGEVDLVREDGRWLVALPANAGGMGIPTAPTAVHPDAAFAAAAGAACSAAPQLDGTASGYAAALTQLHDTLARLAPPPAGELMWWRGYLDALAMAASAAASGDRTFANGAVTLALADARQLGLDGCWPAD